MLVLETKGRDSDQDRTKRKYLADLVEAVTPHGGFGRWRWGVALKPGEIHGILALLSGPLLHPGLVAAGSAAGGSVYGLAASSSSANMSSAFSNRATRDFTIWRVSYGSRGTGGKAIQRYFTVGRCNPTYPTSITLG